MARRASSEGDVFFWLQRLLASLHENLHSRVPCTPEFHASPRLAPHSFFAALIHSPRSCPSQPNHLFLDKSFLLEYAILWYTSIWTAASLPRFLSGPACRFLVFSPRISFIQLLSARTRRLMPMIM